MSEWKCPNCRTIGTPYVAEIEVLRNLLRNPPAHKYWGAGEADCPRDIKCGNGELHSLRCKVCGETNPKGDVCQAAVDAAMAPHADGEGEQV